MLPGHYATKQDTENEEEDRFYTAFSSLRTFTCGHCPNYFSGIAQITFQALPKSLFEQSSKLKVFVRDVFPDHCHFFADSVGKATQTLLSQKME